MLRIVALGLCLVGMTGPAWADDHSAALTECASVPAWARQEPDVPYRIVRMSPHHIQVYCGGAAHQIHACVPESGTSPPYWTIAVISTFSADEFDCAVRYEKAHLSPNHWINPAWETKTRGYKLDIRKTEHSFTEQRKS